MAINYREGDMWAFDEKNEEEGDLTSEEEEMPVY